MEEIGLFPLQMVLLPHERVPLHIFEERYKELVGECIDDACPFGMIMVEEPRMREIGTIAEIDSLQERFPDGRMNVVVRGLRRFRLIERTSGRSFHTAKIVRLSDRPDMPDIAQVESLLEALAHLARAADADTPTTDPSGPDLAFRLAATVELDNHARQELLELDSELERTQRLTVILRELVRRMQRETETQGRAQTNGRVDPRR